MLPVYEERERKLAVIYDHAIHPALNAGWIEPTEKKLSSPRQKYRITEKGQDLLADRPVS